VLSTGGGLVFSADPSGNLIAFDAMTGKILWHASLGAQITNSPETYMLDGHQYILVAAAETLFAFSLQ
jgi:alcohol dehydrogenase (cytochrome c)